LPTTKFTASKIYKNSSNVRCGRERVTYAYYSVFAFYMAVITPLVEECLLANDCLYDEEDFGVG
jgi:hypothetical protein